MELEGHVAVVTGGASGIGRAMAELFAREGAHLRNDAPSAAEPVGLMGRTLAPAAVADPVLAAIRANRPDVITHAEGLEALRRPHERLEQAVLETKA